MDIFVAGFIVGAFVGGLIVALIKSDAGERKPDSGEQERAVWLPPRMRGRISKGDTECRDCGASMREEYAFSKSVRRHWRCPACGYFDSYIDQERARAYQQQAATTEHAARGEGQ